MKRLIAPVNIDFNITDYCNLNCSFCYTQNDMNPVSHISLPIIEKLITEWEQMNVFTINISGGEPLIRKDYAEIFSLFEQSSFQITLNTNGTLIDNNSAKIISRTNFDKVGVSLDGHNRKVYTANRGKDLWIKALNGIELLRNENVPVIPTITLTKYNVHHLLDMVRFCDSLHFLKIGVQFICPTSKKSYDCMPEYNQWKASFLALTDKKKSNQIQTSISFNTTNESPIPWELYLPLQESNRLEDLENTWGISPISFEDCTEVSCPAGKTVCAIAADGKVFGCEMFFNYPSFSMGNVIHESFRTIWNRFEIENILKKDLYGYCNSCPKTFCGGGCRAAAYYYSKNILGDDLRCPSAKIRKRNELTRIQ